MNHHRSKLLLTLFTLVLCIAVAVPTVLAANIARSESESSGQTENSQGISAEALSAEPDVVYKNGKTIRKIYKEGLGYFYETTPDPDVWAWLYETPEETLNASTKELLHYFTGTAFVKEFYFTASSSSPDANAFDERQTPDFSKHSAYEELLRRDDLFDVLEDELGSFLLSSHIPSAQTNKWVHQKAVLALLRQDAVATAAKELPEDSYICLHAFYSGLADSFVAEITDQIWYSYAGTIQTVSGLDVPVYTASRELTDEEKQEYIDYCSSFHNTLVYEPSAKYNCHSFAWYLCSPSNPYWINDISSFVNDETCIEVSFSEAQAGDTIVYYDSDGNALHSGRVDTINPTDGSIYVVSKWGRLGTYRHDYENVPENYCANPSTRTVSCRIYRYHNYDITRTGENYHHGVFHYFEFADQCTICKKQLIVPGKSQNAAVLPA